VSLPPDSIRISTMRTHLLRSVLAAVLATAVTLTTAGCGKAPEAGGGAGGGEATAGRPTVDQGFAVGLLLPDSKTARWENLDRPMFEQNLKAVCPLCTVHHLNAQQDAAKQQTQADALLSRGIQVLVVAPVDARAAAAIVSAAKAQGVPVVSYDRFASGPVDYFVTFYGEQVGQEQGKALLQALEAGGDPRRGPIVMVNGSPSDPNAAQYKQGAHSVLDGKVEIGYEVDTPDWSPDKAQQSVEQALTKLGADSVIGVYAANDGLASGAIAALKGHGVSTLPPVTGQDAELAAIQRVLAGDQYMTIYKPIRFQASAAARMAVAAATGATYEAAEGEKVETLANASGHQVPSVLLSVMSVTRDNVAQTVVADGIYTVEEICTPAFQAACQQAGLAANQQQ
jgi:D-xylose transport system substrate-binding protein